MEGLTSPPVVRQLHVFLFSDPLGLAAVVSVVCWVGVVWSGGGQEWSG